MFIFGLNITAICWTTAKIVDARDLSFFLKLRSMIFQFFMFVSITFYNSHHDKEKPSSTNVCCRSLMANKKTQNQNSNHVMQ